MAGRPPQPAWQSGNAAACKAVALCIGGSNPSAGTQVLVAQWRTRHPPKVETAGSSPAGDTEVRDRVARYQPAKLRHASSNLAGASRWLVAQWTEQPPSK